MGKPDPIARIVLLDDDLPFCRSAQAYLAREGYEVFAESDGRQALSTIDSVQPDILILDIDLGLTDTDGRTICAEISETDRYLQGKLGIILISGRYIHPSDELLGYNAGADNYLTKPFKLTQLAARVKAVNRRIQSAPNDTMPDTGDLTIDFKRREVQVHGKDVELSRIEFDLLAHLIKADGAVCVKSDLLENVWGTIHIEEGAIAKCVSLLRSKIKQQSSHPYVETVFGVGYKFNRDQTVDR